MQEFVVCRNVIYVLIRQDPLHVYLFLYIKDCSCVTIQNGDFVMNVLDQNYGKWHHVFYLGTTRSLDCPALSSLFYFSNQICHLQILQKCTQTFRSVVRMSVAVASVIVTLPVMIMSLLFSFMKGICVVCLFHVVMVYYCIAAQYINLRGDLEYVDNPRPFWMRLISCALLILLAPFVATSLFLATIGIINQVKHFVRFHQFVGSASDHNDIFFDGANDLFSDSFDYLENVILHELIWTWRPKFSWCSE